MWQSSPDTWGPCWSKGNGGTQPCVLEGGGNGNAPAYIHIPGIEDTLLMVTPAGKTSY